MKNCLFIFLNLIGLTSYGQNLNVDSLFINFKENVEIEQKEHSGRLVWDYETKEAYFQLAKFCSSEKFVQFMNDSNPAIRVYMFLGLLHGNMNNQLVEQVLKSHNNDTAKFSETTGCLVFLRKVNEDIQQYYDLKLKGDLDELNYDSEIIRIRDQLRIIIEGMHHGIVQKVNISQIERLDCNQIGYEVTSFKLLFRSRYFRSSSNSLTMKMRKKLRNIKVGEKLYLENIKVKMPDNIVRNLGTIMITVR